VSRRRWASASRALVRRWRARSIRVLIGSDSKDGGKRPGLTTSDRRRARRAAQGDDKLRPVIHRVWDDSEQVY
jgi:hypothetical protein